MAEKLTSPDKVLFPKLGITKGQMAEYYSKVAHRMMPYLKNRLLSSVRCPQGIESACFFKKHPKTDNKNVGIVNVMGADGETDEYFYLKNKEGLMYEVQMNTVEFHLWGSTVDHLENPDMMVFDLDPDEGMGLEQIRQGVRDLKSLLDDLSLTTFLKTSGGKGYHIVIPFIPSSDWTSFKEFAHNIAKLMESTWPGKYTSNSRKNKRRGRIFVDWLRNGRGATSIASYSLRSRESASVSMPLSWKELDKVAPADIHMEEAIKRLKGKDPWEGFFDIEQKFK